ncbi:hypothetical protein SBRY_40578 [Actinacidiphila bryophytorum]|uniref:Uncharacterized protein n=1 Tax=Actinacidiphila bryophytorum TaxID=1436133 RepID=A0A9W4MDB2_9ACTN|nr:hypothetical protein SBRY_40578 [Actinacidiphila bryophytorum]
MDPQVTAVGKGDGDRRTLHRTASND